MHSVPLAPRKQRDINDAGETVGYLSDGYDIAHGFLFAGGALD